MYLNIGFNNYVNQQYIITVVEYGPAPIVRQVRASRDSGTLIDATNGRKIQSVIFTDNRIIVSALRPETLIQKCK